MDYKKLRSVVLVGAIGFTAYLLFGIINIFYVLLGSQCPDGLMRISYVMPFLGNACVAASAIMALTSQRLDEMKPAFGCLLGFVILSMTFLAVAKFYEYEASDYSDLYMYWLLMEAVSAVIALVGCAAYFLLMRRIKAMLIPLIATGVSIVAGLLFIYIYNEVVAQTEFGLEPWVAWESMESFLKIAQILSLVSSIGIIAGWWLSLAEVEKYAGAYAAPTQPGDGRRGTVPLGNRKADPARINCQQPLYNPVADDSGYGGFNQNFNFGNQPEVLSTPQAAPASAQPAGLKAATDDDLMKIVHDTTDKYSVEEQEEASLILFERRSQLLFGELQRYTPEQISQIANNPDEYFKGYVYAAKSLIHS